MNRPLAATASGQDWAFIKEHDLPGLVRGWIALGYAAGDCLMAPVRQWCYTPEKGTHWYAGPKEKFAPLYQFVRRNTFLFDGYDTYADLTVVMPHQSFVKHRELWFKTCAELAAANLSYRLVVAGDQLVRHPLPAGELRAAQKLLVLDPSELEAADRSALERLSSSARVFTTTAQAIAEVTPAVRVEAAGKVRVLPRIRPGSAVIHLLNHDF